MADDNHEQSKNPQPAGNLPGRIKDTATEVAAWLRAVIQAPATDIEADRSGQLAPPHSPTIRDAGDGQPGGWVKARHLADSPPPSITESILRDPGRYLPPEPEPEPEHDKERER